MFHITSQQHLLLTLSFITKEGLTNLAIDSIILKLKLWKKLLFVFHHEIFFKQVLVVLYLLLHFQKFQIKVQENFKNYCFRFTRLLYFKESVPLSLKFKINFHHLCSLFILPFTLQIKGLFHPKLFLQLYWISLD